MPKTLYVAPGWGLPSTYELSLYAANTKAGKFFGTLNGKGTAANCKEEIATTDAGFDISMRILTQVGNT